MDLVKVGEECQARPQYCRSVICPHAGQSDSTSFDQPRRKLTFEQGESMPNITCYESEPPVGYRSKNQGSDSERDIHH